MADDVIDAEVFQTLVAYLLVVAGCMDTKKDQANDGVKVCTQSSLTAAGVDGSDPTLLFG